MNYLLKQTLAPLLLFSCLSFAIAQNAPDQNSTVIPNDQNEDMQLQQPQQPQQTSAPIPTSTPTPTPTPTSTPTSTSIPTPLPTQTGLVSQTGYTLLVPDKLQWNPSTMLPSGALISVLDGDPTQSGPFTIRIKMPANYMIPPHWNQSISHGTVISGSLNIGFGDTLDKTKGTNLTQGSFFILQPNTHQFEWTDDVETVLQVSGVGPLNITYVNPGDDPRIKNTSGPTSSELGE